MIARGRFAVLLAIAIAVVSCSGASESSDTTQTTTVEVSTSEAAAEADPVADASPGADGLAGTVAIVDVRVYDGAEVLPSTTVIVENGLIAAIGTDVEVPADAHVVDGSGKTLLPGLIDSHTHTFDSSGLTRAVEFGVTTHLDMFTSPQYLELEQAAEERLAERPQADLFSAGVLGTVEDGHGTQFGIDIPTLDTADEAPQWVEDRVEEGADFIKLVLEDGSEFGRQIPTLDEATLRAALDQAASRGLLSITHVSTIDSATVAISSGSDGLAHLFFDTIADSTFVDLAVANEAFVVPTVVVISSGSSSPSGQVVIDDRELGSRLTSFETSNLSRSLPDGQLELAVVLDSVTRLHAAGVPILAGSDAPNPGTAYGASLHHELEYFTDAGLSAVEALASATSVPAEIFGLVDRGRIAPGLLADLLLVNGDPTTDITATRSIVAVWKNGIPILIS